MKNPHDIIKRPVLTEKAYEGIGEKRYVFEVDIRANKAEIGRRRESCEGEHRSHDRQNEAAGPHPGDDP